MQKMCSCVCIIMHNCLEQASSSLFLEVCQNSYYYNVMYTTQHRAVLIIFPLILQTSTRAQMLSIGGTGEHLMGGVYVMWPEN